MHLKSFLFLLVFILILPQAEMRAQLSDSAAAYSNDSLLQEMLKQEMLLERQKLEREKNRQILELKDAERNVKNRRLIIIAVIAVCILIFVAGIVLLVFLLVRKR